ncbi:hypothetical protein AB0M48_22760 [Lentzea sp. NPDC051208]|uniref:HAAS signaling domain-containing protein n=1 Tax=Lentzea sp. NPDC051208 TaxID=3154642 RepID=UPI003447E18A
MSRPVVEHPLVTNYMSALLHDASVLSEARRAELAEEIRSHIEISLPENASEIEIRNLLDRLGEPSEIVAAELDDRPSGSQVASAPLKRSDLAGLALLLLGGALLPPVGYLVGTGLIGLSRRWSVPVRVLLTGLPCAGGLMWVFGFVSAGQWYSLTDLTTDPRGAVGDFVSLGLLALPYTSLQVAALLAIRYITTRSKRA